MLGIILQKKLTQDMDTSFQKAAAYIESGAEWYVTDIIGERVFGVALLTQFNVSLKKLKVLSKHPCNWVVRAIGPGAHYAIKKGLLVRLTRKHCCNPTKNKLKANPCHQPCGANTTFHFDESSNSSDLSSHRIWDIRQELRNQKTIKL